MIIYYSKLLSLFLFSRYNFFCNMVTKMAHCIQDTYIYKSRSFSYSKIRNQPYRTFNRMIPVSNSSSVKFQFLQVFVLTALLFKTGLMFVNFDIIISYIIHSLIMFAEDIKIVASSGFTLLEQGFNLQT